MGWRGVDLDCTLAKYPTPGGLNQIGEPIKPMLNMVLDWLNAGEDIRIFTARAVDPEQVLLVEAWCLEHLGRKIPVTNVKDFGMICLYDDRAVQVERNTGRLLGAEPE